ncbi:MAG: diguanylate cyclase (GGDEF)-like protein [Flavobacteriales bacterium]
MEPKDPPELPSLETFDETLVHRARNDLVFRTQASAIVTICVVVLAFSYILYGDVPHIALVVWASLTMSSYALRYVIYRNYHASTDEQKSLGHWQTLFTFSSALSGFLWGISIFVVFPENSLNHQMLQILLMVILSAATTVTHTAYKWAGVLFSVFCLVPAVIKLFLIDESGYSELAYFLVLFVLIMFSSAKYLSQIANRMFMLGYENEVLIRELKLTNGDLHHKNEQLEETKKDLSAANDSLHRLATTDALTNLTNRRKFEALVQVKWNRCLEQGVPISLVLINVDMFKQYNDFYGQRKGDSCLVLIAEALSQIPELNKQGDCIARYSGDEFAVLLINERKDAAIKTAERIRSDIEYLRISRAEMPHELSTWITVSVGVSTEENFDNGSYDNLLERVDGALIQAKRNGRNQIARSA